MIRGIVGAVIGVLAMWAAICFVNWGMPDVAALTPFDRFMLLAFSLWAAGSGWIAGLYIDNKGEFGE